MKRIFFLLLTVTLALFALTACFGTVYHQYTSDCDPFCDCCPMPVEREVAVEHTRATCESTECSVCLTEIEAIEHTYSSNCDADCDACGLPRTELQHTYANACSSTCSVCGAAREGMVHTYSSACDASCDVCGETRADIPHAYLYACSGICSDCGATRYTQHNYEFDCSVACKDCGETRTISASAHDFEFGCSLTCDVCGFTRIGDFHAYTDACDQICDYGCGYERENQCVWEGLCNNLRCANCGATKSIEHTDANGDFICDVETCLAICDHICVNDDSLDCDRLCTICGTPLAGHTYSAACDTDCDIAGCTSGDRAVGEGEDDAKAHAPKAACGTVCRYCGIALVIEGEPVAHTYDGDCDTTCNECGETRPAGDHTPSETLGCEICDVCGEFTGASHAYHKACDAACYECGKANPNAGHVGNFSCSPNCKYCGAVLDSIEHEFAQDCSTHCANCGEHLRTDAADDHTDADGDKICDLCFEELPTTGDGVLPEHTIPAKKNDE